MGWGSWDSQSPNLDPNSPLLPLALRSLPPAIGGGVGMPPHTLHAPGPTCLVTQAHSRLSPRAEALIVEVLCKPEARRGSKGVFPNSSGWRAAGSGQRGSVSQRLQPEGRVQTRRRWIPRAPVSVFVPCVHVSLSVSVCVPVGGGVVRVCVPHAHACQCGSL